MEMLDNDMLAAERRAPISGNWSLLGMRARTTIDRARTGNGKNGGEYVYDGRSQPRRIRRSSRCTDPGVFSIPMDHLTAVPTMAGYFRNKGFNDAVIVSPDAGRVRWLKIH